MTIVASDVLALVKHGIYPVRLHYPIFRGKEVYCSCGKAAECGGIGKHPVASAWGKSATQDESIITEQWGMDRWNVGIVLGPCYGIPADKAIVDIEDDSESGAKLAEALGLGTDFPCPMYTSGKSTHRLYRWTPDLPETGAGIKSNLTIDGLEFRFGGNGKQTQSVAPPSVHRNGANYEWVPGHSLDDIPLTPLPAHVIAYVCKHQAAKSGTGTADSGVADGRRFRSKLGKIGVGSRHHSLLVEANNLWRRAYQIWGINGIEEQAAADQVYMWLMGANLLVCDPPKSDAEIQVILQSAYDYMREEFVKELNEKLTHTEPKAAEDEQDRSLGSYLHSHKIRLMPDPNLDPTLADPGRIDEWSCEWLMQYITKGDEDLVQIDIDGYGPIVMNSREFEGASSFARKIQQETGGKFTLNKTFTHWDWKSLWEGRPNDKKKANGITRGLREFLTAKAEVVEKEENGLLDQVEDIILAMSGNLQQLLDGLENYRTHGHKFSGRLKTVPGGELTEIRAPEDPLSGYYFEDEQIWLLVKMDELSRRYRSSFGGIVQTRQLVDSLVSLGFEKKRLSRGAMQGRWFARQENK